MCVNKSKIGGNGVIFRDHLMHGCVCAHTYTLLDPWPPPCSEWLKIEKNATSRGGVWEVHGGPLTWCTLNWNLVNRNPRNRIGALYAYFQPCYWADICSTVFGPTLVSNGSSWNQKSTWLQKEWKESPLASYLSMVWYDFATGKSRLVISHQIRTHGLKWVTKPCLNMVSKRC